MITAEIEPVGVQPFTSAFTQTAEFEDELLKVFKLLSDRTRLRIVLYLVREQELHVSALCLRLGQSQPAVSHHLGLLKDAGLIEPRRQGKYNFYSLCRTQISRVIAGLLDQVDGGRHAPDRVAVKTFVSAYEG